MSQEEDSHVVSFNVGGVSGLDTLLSFLPKRFLNYRIARGLIKQFNLKPGGDAAIVFKTAHGSFQIVRRGIAHRLAEIAEEHFWPPLVVDAIRWFELPEVAPYKKKMPQAVM